MKLLRFDVAVIGAGPAGAAAAATAVRVGLSVALIDHKSFPRNKLCGGLITGRSMRYFRDVFGENLTVDPLERKEVIEFQFQGRDLGRISDAPPMFLSMRWEFDHHLVERAVAMGAEDMTGQQVEAIDIQTRRIALKDGRTLAYGVMIGADGANSMVARRLFGRSFDRSRIGFGLEIEAPSVPRPAEAPLSVNIAAAQWGYGWSFPKDCSTTIGVGGLLTENDDFKSALTDYLRILGVEADERDFKGQFLPFGDFRKQPGSGSVLLAGDAAGLVDPITGEGIAYALKSGQMAARAAKSASTTDTPEVALRLYQKQLRPIHRSLRMANLIRPMIFHPRFQPTFERAFRGSVTVRRKYLDLLAGEIGYGAILAACLWRMPRMARMMMLSKGVR